MFPVEERRGWRATAVLDALVLLLTGCPQPSTRSSDPAGEESAPESSEKTSEGSWEEVPDAPIAPRINHTATWAGDQLLVWGGQDQDTRRIAADGAAWYPATGEWRRIPEAPIDGRWAHEAVWTGDELLVWGGTAGPDHLADCYTDGARYHPPTGEWKPIAEAPGASRCGATVVWTGHELLAFGGHSGDGPPEPGDRHDDGVSYDPEADEWRTLPAAPISPRAGGVAAWIGEEMVVYGGHSQDGTGFSYREDGAAYDPEADAWRQIDESPLPALLGMEGLAVDDELMVFAGQEPEVGTPSTAAASYDPEREVWRTLAGMPGTHGTLEAVEGDGAVYVLGGGVHGPPDEAATEDEAASPDEAASEDAASPFVAYLAGDDRWIERPDPPGGPRRHHALAWTGVELIVWGGQSEDEQAPTGLRWKPPTDDTDRAALRPPPAGGP